MENASYTKVSRSLKVSSQLGYLRIELDLLVIEWKRLSVPALGRLLGEKSGTFFLSLRQDTLCTSMKEYIFLLSPNMWFYV